MKREAYKEGGKAAKPAKKSGSKKGAAGSGVGRLEKIKKAK